MIVRKRRQVIRRPERCPICTEGIELSYKDPNVLKTNLTSRGKIVGRDKTGICATHQRKLAREIKRARHLALLSFVRQVR